MTQAEKYANKLVTMYFQIQEPYFRMPDLRLAKKDALICVDEIIKVIDAIHLRFMNDRPDLYYDSDTIDQFHYWQEVKQEIEKL